MVCRPRIDDRRHLLWTARHYGAVRQASGRDRLVWSRRLPHLLPLAGAGSRLYLFRGFDPAPVGDRRSEVCVRFPGDLHRGRCRNEPGNPPNTVVATWGAVHTWAAAVRRGYAPRRYPVALGGWRIWLWRRVVRSVCVASTCARAAGGGADGVRSGVAGVCALVRTA